MRCAPPANRPSPQERDTCLPWTARELELLPAVRVVLCLGAFAWDAALRLRAPAGLPAARPRPRFGHGALWEPGGLGGPPLLGCFHPSQQNTFTGRLTPAMLDDVLRQALASVVPEHVVHPVLLEGWWFSRPPTPRSSG